MQWSIQQQVILGKERREGEWGRERERVIKSIIGGKLKECREVV